MNTASATAKILLLFSLALSISSCSSKLVVQSTPTEAEVYMSAPGKNNPIKMGVTPLELKEGEISDKLQISPGQSGLLEVTFKKKTFQTKTMLVPANRWGETARLINVSLVSGDDNKTYAQLMVRHLMNAQKLAQSRQYEQALTELDRSLAFNADFAPALVMKGSVFFLQQQFVEAEKWYKRALEAAPDTEEAVKMLERIKKINTEGSRT